MLAIEREVPTLSQRYQKWRFAGDGGVATSCWNNDNGGELRACRILILSTHLSECEIGAS